MTKLYRFRLGIVVIVVWESIPFPPLQVAILPVSEKYVDYAQRVLSELASAGVRAIIDEVAEQTAAC